MPNYTSKDEEEKKVKEAIDGFVGFMSAVKEVEKAQQSLVKNLQVELKSKKIEAIKKKTKRR